MRTFPLGAAAAAIALPAAPAAAEGFAGSSFGSGSTGAYGGATSGSRWDGHRDGRDRHRGNRRSDGAIVVGQWGSSDAWALYNNRTFDPESFNDWWHERPWRSYPRWMSRNENCERMWWSGGGWTCGR